MNDRSEEASEPAGEYSTAYAEIIGEDDDLISMIAASTKSRSESSL